MEVKTGWPTGGLWMIHTLGSRIVVFFFFVCNIVEVAANVLKPGYFISKCRFLTSLFKKWEI